MGITNPVDFEKIAIITAGCKPLVTQCNNRIDSVKGGIYPGTVDSDAP